MTKLQRKTTREKIIDAVTEMEAEAIYIINLERRLGRDALAAWYSREQMSFRDKYGVAAMDVYNQVQMRKGKRDFRDSRKMKYRLHLVKKANGTVEWVD